MSAGITRDDVQGPDAAVRGEPLTILVVEDNRDARTTLRMLLTLAYGHVVYEADTGATAVTLALEHRPRIALVDLGLPDMDGYEVARRIRSDHAADGIRLIALTGYGDDEDRERTRRAGFDAHLVKPVESEALVRLFAEVVQQEKHCGGAEPAT